ncbi:hypothetical protein [Mucilaginibacter sp.]|jgi:proteasome lid subunit RPN8/RPN11|uniref:hypothetical protein n=1 Tax=Mucilaginibacter sp. TaxID=1882438 RepID=UPI003565CEE3
MEQQQLNIDFKLWEDLIKELKLRGRGMRESGAFLLGPLSEREITRYICYDDLDPHALDSGIIVFDSKGFTPLWKFCKDNQLKVYADVHTHPDGWTGQSGVDKDNPMIVQSGHIALIIPRYSQVPLQGLEGVGAYIYLGSKKWKTFDAAENIINIKIEKHGIIRKYLQQIINRFNRKK